MAFAAEPDIRTSTGAHGLLLLASAVDAAENTAFAQRAKVSSAYPAPVELAPVHHYSKGINKKECEF